MSTCGNCGETLIGNVNRCWRCGTRFLAAPDSGTVPPKRSELTPTDIPMARLVDVGSTAPHESSDNLLEHPLKVSATLSGRESWRDHAVIAALAVACVSVFGSLISKWAVVTALMATVLLAAGFRSSRKKVIWGTVLLCAFAFVLAGIQTIREFRAYQLQQQESDYAADF
jgi:hypothetical protein